MATRTATLYQGEDLSPTYDYTDQVIWEESEFGTRAWQGEGSASTIVIRDPLGEQGNQAGLPSGLTLKLLSAKNLFVIKLGSDWLFRGRVGIKNYSRDGQQIERYRQVECELHDTNWDLDQITVHDYPRPSEADDDRIRGLIASHLSGSPRETTALNGSNFISGSNTVTLPAQTYQRTSPLGIIREVAKSANKQFFVTGDALGGGSLFYDGNDSTAYACTLSISDRASEVNHSTVFPPIWNVGAASTEDGSDLLDEVVLFWGTGDDDFVTAHDLTVHTQYGHASTIITDDTAKSATEALRRANAILAHRKYEDKTYNVTIGPLTDAQVVLIKHGQTIGIKARAIPDADDQTRTMRIVQCRYTTPVPGTWFAHLQLGRPWKMEPYGTGPVLTPQPPSAGAAASCALSDAQMTAISTPNGGFEDGDATNWTFSSISGGVTTTDPHDGTYCASLQGTGFWNYFLPAGHTFAAGTSYVCRFWYKSTDGTNTVEFGVSGDKQQDTAVGGAADWTEYCIVWTPSTTVSSGVFVGMGTASLRNLSVDTLRMFEGTDADIPPASDDDAGDVGSVDSGCFATCDHKHPAQTAAVTPVTDAGGYFTGTQVEAVTQEIGADLATGGEIDGNARVGVRKNSTGSTFERRRVNLIEGTGVTLTVADDSGNEEVDVTIAASGGGGSLTVEEVDGTPSVAASTLVFPNGTLTDNGGGEVEYTPAGGGGSGVTHTYVGYNTIGGTDETMVLRRHYMKKITLAAAGTLVAIEAYIKTTSDSTTTRFRFCIFEDNAGTPRYLLDAQDSGPVFLKPSNGVEAFRWFGTGMSRYLAAGDYWIGVATPNENQAVIKKDGSGSDRYFTAGGDWSLDAGYNTITTTTDTYSIRASILT